MDFMKPTKIAIIAFSAAMVIQSAHALEIGDRFSLGRILRYTVSSITQRSHDSVEFIAEHSERDARAFCYDPAYALGYPNKSKCIGDLIGHPRKYRVECRPAMIAIDDDAYRPQVSGGPWISITKKDQIIQGDSLYVLACKK